MSLLIVVKSNRRAPAWLILLPVVAVALVWSMLARLLVLPAEIAAGFADLLVPLAASWAAVWLLAAWLGRRSVAAALVLAIVTMLATCGVFYISVYYPGSAEFDVWDMLPWGVGYAAGALVLPMATALSARCCRRAYRPRWFVAWLLLWTIIASILLAIPIAIMVAAQFAGEDLLEFLPMLLGAIFSLMIAGGLLGVLLYLMSLPFMFLAVRSPFYRERFQRVLRLTPAETGSASVPPFAGALPALDTVQAAMAEDER